jgi:hypothetical protein
MEHSLTTTIDFQKDFEDHMRELASEISGLHLRTSLTWADDLSTLLKFNGQLSEDDAPCYLPF